MQLFVSKNANFARFAVVGGLAFPDDSGLVRGRGVQVFVQAVVTDVGLAADEPFGERNFPLEDLLPWLEPDQFLFGLLRPEFLGRTDRFIVKLAIISEGFDMSTA